MPPFDPSLPFTKVAPTQIKKKDIDQKQHERTFPVRPFPQRIVNTLLVKIIAVLNVLLVCQTPRLEQSEGQGYGIRL